MNRKGTARDVGLIAIGIFTFAIVAFIANFFISTGVSSMTAVSVVNESNATVTALNSADDVATDKFDQLVLGLFIGYVLAMMITSWIVGGNPVFMFIYFIVVVVTVVIAMPLANAWETITQSSVFGTTIVEFSIANHLMSFLPLYVGIIGVLGLIVMFAKPFMSGGEYA